MILIEFSLLGFVSAFSGALLSPTVDQLAREFNIPPHVATHTSVVYIAIGALAPLVLVPFANVYGHRLVTLSCTAVNVAANFAAAEVNSFSTLVVLRGFSGFGITLSVLSVAVIPNLFFAHQRGRATGFYLASLAAGSHAALIVGFFLVSSIMNNCLKSKKVGGYVTFRLGWRWALRIAGISLGEAIFLS
jgi:MFS family permease